ncbi:MAG: hypothetical protein CL949_13690 [Erythrobacter sp.]|nr:hypothetical protein [Erythrobacter sp.]|tara:strand:+ start:201 stop:482 length:282 start_codon:yes stop_codon:yes gene_type:complete
MTIKLDDRIFVGHFPTGICYADRKREKHGDWARLAILFYSDLRAEFEPDCPPALRQQIAEHMATIQARRGEQYQISGSGQTIKLGYALPDVNA